MLGSLWRNLTSRGLFYIGSSAFVTACLLFGGGTQRGLPSDVVVQVLAIPMLLACLWRYLDLPPGERPSGALKLALAIAAVPALQLLPLPPQIWSNLPGRTLIADGLQLLDAELPWAPLSVSPSATWLSLLSLMPPLAVFLAVVLSDFQQRRHLSVIILLIAAASVFLGLVQAAQGPESALRFYAVTNPTEAVGFFANRNHYSAFLYIAVLFTAAWAVQTATTAASVPKTAVFEAAIILPLFATFTLVVALVAGEMAGRSRAGVGLMMIALISAFGLAVSDRRAIAVVTPAKLLLGSAIVASIIVAQFALYRVFDRFSSDPLGDARIPFARNTLAAARAYFPTGAGMGTFIPVYGSFEKPEDTLPNTFANRAHNDVLELALESGLLGAAVVALLAIWIIPKTLRLWRRDDHGAGRIDLLLARAATLCFPLLLLHSFFDYPLRTCGIMTVFAFCCALLVAPPPLLVRYEDRSVEEPKVRQRPSRGTAPGASPAFPWPAEPGAPGTRHGGERWGRGIAWPDEWSPGGSSAGDRPPRKRDPDEPRS